MRYFRRPTPSGHRLVADDGETWYDLAAAEPALTGFGSLARAAASAGDDVDTFARRLLDDAERLGTRPAALSTPVRAEEVWAAGVTYHISEAAREAESDMPEIYLRVYDAERPELFFKATASRTVGPDEAVGVRGDSDWNVPEPELGLVLHRGETVGYTVGNDVSSRAIEGENPLYLPQAKVYDRCCALGPCVASPASVEDPTALEMSMRIRRDGAVVFEDATSTAEMARDPESLVDWLRRHNRLPDVAVLLTGTSLVPPDEFTLEAGDAVEIEIERIGTLENPVTVV